MTVVEVNIIVELQLMSNIKYNSQKINDEGW
jgi:hypothetical protein